MYNEWKLSLQESEAGFHYFEWLCDLVGVDVFDDFSYSKLLDILWKTPFIWSVPNDDNRVADGFNLRNIYFKYDDFILSKPDGNVSVLEVMIGLAIRMDDLLIQPGEDSQIGSRFFELIDNLGLTPYSNNTYDPVSDDSEIQRILSVFLERRYDKNGRGGIFPLINAEYDQRKTELWYQLNSYVLQNYVGWADDTDGDIW